MEILDVMAEPGAVDYLNACESNLFSTVSMQTIQDIYPFQLENQVIPNFVLLLNWAAEAYIPQMLIATSDNSWLRFLDIVLSPKSEENLQEWRRLPQDRVKWTPKINTLIIGKLLFNLPFLAGCFVILIFLMDNDQPDVFELILLCGIYVYPGGAIAYISWWIWKHVISTWGGTTGTFEAYPTSVQAYLKPFITIDIEENSIKHTNLISVTLFALPAYCLILVIMYFSNVAAWLPPWGVIVTGFTLFFTFFCLPSLSWFDSGRVIYPLGKPNRYLDLYQIPGVERWLPPEEKE